MNILETLVVSRAVWELLTILNLRGIREGGGAKVQDGTNIRV